MSTASIFADLNAGLGQEIYCSDWHQITQEHIDAFAFATGDHQWIHCDAARSARESSAGCTIAHGYLVLGLYPMLRGLTDERKPAFPGAKRVVNYGMNKVRFPNSVKVGARVRARCTLNKIEEVPGGLQLIENYTLEIEGASKPGCAGEVIMRLYFE